MGGEILELYSEKLIRETKEKIAINTILLGYEEISISEIVELPVNKITVLIEKIEVAKKMITEGMEESDICRILELSVEHIHIIKAGLGKGE